MLNARVTAGHRPAHAQEEPAGWDAFPGFVKSHKIFLQNRVKILNSRVLAGSFVMECPKKSWFEACKKK